MKKHILIIPSWYSFNYFDKARGSFFKNHALALKNKGLKVGVVAAEIHGLREFNKNKYKFFNYNYSKDDNVPTVFVSLLNIVPRVEIIRVFILFLLTLLGYYKYISLKGTPDIIHCHSALYAGWISTKIFSLLNIPIIITEHSSYFGLSCNSKIDIKKILAKSALNKADKIIFVSESLRNDAECCLKKKFKRSDIIPNFLRKDFTIKKYNNKPEERNITFITIGSLDKNKNQKIIIEAFFYFLKDFKNSNLKIIGNGSEKKKLLKFAMDLGIIKNINFINYLIPGEIALELKNSSIFVLSSNYETFSVATLEALAMGLPVIVTKCGGPEKMINNDNGLLIKKDSVEEMYSAMVNVYKNIHNYDKRKIIKNILNICGPEAVVKKIDEIYDNLLKSKINRK